LTRDSEMKSCIYTGHVRHRRFVPKENSFRYALFLMFIDLGELDTVTAGSSFWSIDAMNLAYLRRRDHFGDPHISIEQSVRDLVEQRTGKRPEGPVRMLCHFRYFGHCFNPASFYFCYDAQDTRVETIIIEVHNTPWGEVFLYVLNESLNQGRGNRKQYAFDKNFHVSPFMGMDMHYDWRFSEPGSELNIHMNSYHGREKYFDATLTLKRQEINSRSLNRMLIEYPFVTAKVIAMIYWQALRLLVKRVPFYSHPPKQGGMAGP
jgi:DUF1365 family protein